jgi:hypothetical protein
MNYGLGSRIQLKYQVPYLVEGTDGGPTRSGLGKSLAGVKWRFYDSDEKGLQISTYPQLEFNNPTSSLQRGLVDYGTRFYLPIELTRRLDRSRSIQKSAIGSPARRGQPGLRD